VEETFVKIEQSHKETRRQFDIYKKGFAKFSQWQGAFNRAVLKIVALEKKDQEKTKQIEILLNKVVEL